MLRPGCFRSNTGATEVMTGSVLTVPAAESSSFFPSLAEIFLELCMLSVFFIAFWTHSALF